MNKKLFMIGFILVILLGWLLSGCSGQPGVPTGDEDLPSLNAKPNRTLAATGYPMPDSGNPGAEPGYPAPGPGNPGADLGYPAPGLVDNGANPNAPNPGNPAVGGSFMPLSMKLALGTLELEDTDQAVTVEQSVYLLPLWKGVYILSTAEDTKAEDLEKAFQQIQEAMTSEQMEAIQSMQFTGEELSSLTEKYGIELPAGPMTTLTGEQQATMQASRPGGPPPMETPPEGRGSGNGFPGGTGTPPPGGAPFPLGVGNPPDHPGGSGDYDQAIYQVVRKLLESKSQ